MDDLDRRVEAYQTAMAVVRRMLAEGLISRKDYDEIDRLLAQKHGLSLCSIFR